MTIDLTPAKLRELAENPDRHRWFTREFALALADAMEERDRLRLARGFLDRDAEVLKAALLTAQEELTTRGGELVQLRADLEAARGAINYATENILDYDDAEWAAWNAMPAVRAALGKDADGND